MGACFQGRFRRGHHLVPLGRARGEDRTPTGCWAPPGLSRVRLPLPPLSRGARGGIRTLTPRRPPVLSRRRLPVPSLEQSPACTPRRSFHLRGSLGGVLGGIRTLTPRRPPALDRRRLPVPSRGLVLLVGGFTPPSPPCAAARRDRGETLRLRLLCVAVRVLLRCLCLAAVPLRGAQGLRRGNRTLACPVSGETGRQTVAGDRSPPTRESNPHRGLRRPPSRSTLWEIERRHDTLSWSTPDPSSSPETNRTSSCEIRSLTVGSTAGGMPTRPGWSRARVRSVVRGNRTLVHRSRNGGPVPLDDDHREQCRCTAARPKGFEPS